MSPKSQYALKATATTLLAAAAVTALVLTLPLIPGFSGATSDFFTDAWDWYKDLSTAAKVGVGAGVGVVGGAVVGVPSYYIGKAVSNQLTDVNTKQTAYEKELSGSKAALISTKVERDSNKNVQSQLESANYRADFENFLDNKLATMVRPHLEGREYNQQDIEIAVRNELAKIEKAHKVVDKSYCVNAVVDRVGAIRDELVGLDSPAVNNDLVEVKAKELAAKLLNLEQTVIVQKNTGAAAQSNDDNAKDADNDVDNSQMASKYKNVKKDISPAGIAAQNKARENTGFGRGDE